MKAIILVLIVGGFAVLAFAANAEVGSKKEKADETIQDYDSQRITFASRAPTASDKGLLWVKESSGTTSFYTRNRTSGTWTLIGP